MAMKKQAQVIISELEKRGWVLSTYEYPESKPYWWVWAFYVFRKGEKRLVLSFLTDPMNDTIKKEVYKIAASEKEPGDRLEAEQGAVLWFNRGWQERTSEWLAEIAERFG
jgi:hypothetical protein